MIKKIKCWSIGHDWTCAAEEGIPATKEQMNGGVAGFWSYAQMYCKRCGEISSMGYRPMKTDRVMTSPGDE